MKLRAIASVLAILAVAPSADAASRRSNNARNAADDVEQDMQNRRKLQDQRSRRPAHLRPINMEPGDLNFRFNKIPVLRGDVADRFPLTNKDYPMRGKLGRALKWNTTAESVMTADDYELRNVAEEDFMAMAGGSPTYPNADSSHPYWTEFREVMEAQVHYRANGTVSDVMTPPKLWENFTIADVADAVHDEYPGSIQADMINYFISIGLKIDHTILPFRGHNDFVGRNFRAAKINTWATGQVAATNFRTKWTYGRPRPEEVCWAIHNNGPLAPYAPADLVDLIDSWNLANSFDCTSYKDTGSPRHPSYPAMHSAASSASMWMSVVFDLTPFQRCDVLRTDWAVSYARTVAGVHYRADNIVGLNMGQDIVAARLADMLVREYGANRAAAEAKIARMQFDWNDFDHRTCATTPATN